MDRQGRIGIFDHDRVEMSNLQRQILHDESTVGMYKAESAKRALLRFVLLSSIKSNLIYDLCPSSVNSRLSIDAITSYITSSNALTLLAPYDLILDCTDNVPTRYLLSDTAVALDKPLVSGAAQRFDGQLSVYHLGEDDPCYRCVFPVPPKMSSGVGGSCEEVGVLGGVTGVVGNLQAVEAVKILTGLHGASICLCSFWWVWQKYSECIFFLFFLVDRKPVMHIYNALATPPFRTIKLRSRRATCPACGTEKGGKDVVRDTDYVQFCGGLAPDWEWEGLVDGEEGKRVDAKVRC